MRNRALHDALRDFALEAAARLTADVRDGAELAFDVVAEPGAGSVLYRYEPLTTDFIDERWEALRRLPACAAAAESLSGGAELYLRVHGGAASADPEPALRAMLERLYRDATSFEFPEQRFERVYAELEGALYDNCLRAAIVAPLLGAALERERVDLGDGLFLVAGDKFDAPPEAVWQPVRDASPNVLCVLRRDIDADAPLPLAEAGRRFRLVLRALRLLKPGGVALGPLAFGRVDEGGWRPLPLATPGVARAGGIILSAAEEPEVSELMGLLERPGAAPVAWALARFEMGLDRPHDTEALSDYLLALRGLFEADDDASRASLPLRLAALCADPPERRVLKRRVEQAFMLESRLRAGAVSVDDDPRTLVVELEECLRAILRDVVCGYLEPDLRAAADDVLVTSGEPVEIVATDLRADRAGDGREPADELDPAVAPPDREPAFAGPEREHAAPLPTDEIVVDPTRPDRDDPTQKAPAEPPASADGEPDRPEEPTGVGVIQPKVGRDDLEVGVTHSTDWDDAPDWDDDPANWSAPV
jgi:hypothetical protein